MKAIKYIILGIGLFFAGGMQAQITVNLGSPPQWGPSGYSDVRYYYLPDVDSYYDVQTSRFIYYSGNSWVHRKSLPTQYRNYDLYNGYKVVLSDYRGNAPYGLYKQHKVKYAKGYRGAPQKSIGNNPGKGHYKSKGNNGNHKSNGNKKGKKH
ncbi:MAG: hypothetical protein Q7J19_06920 [Lutibacter sp.]|nr:hypothetical protein [Lutibacter sp.]